MSLNKFNKYTLIVMAWLMLFTLNASAQTDSAKANSADKSRIKDFADATVKKWQNGEIDFSKHFGIEMSAVITKDGKLDDSGTKFLKSEGDEDIVSLAKSAINAFSDSQLLNYLGISSVKNISAFIKQDSDTFSVKIISNMKSDKEAKTFATGFKALILIMKLQTELSEDEKLLINSMKTPTSSDSQTTLEFEMPTALFQDLIYRELIKVSRIRQK